MSDIFSALGPLLSVTRLIGLAPFKISLKNKSFTVCIPGLIYSALMLVLFTANAVFLTYTKLTYTDRRIDSYVGLASDVILLTCGIVVTVCCILLAILQRKKYARVVHDFHAIGFEIAKLSASIPYDKLYVFSRYQIFSLFVVLLLLFTHTTFYIQNLSNLIFASYMYAWFGPKIYNFLMESQFVSGVLLLKMHYGLLNKSLEEFEENGAEFGEKDSGDLPNFVNANAWSENWEISANKRLTAQTFSVWERKTVRGRRENRIWSVDESLDALQATLDKIKIIRKIHCNLCEITKHLNSSFSLQLLASIAQSFIFITANLYMLFTTISSSTTVTGLALSYPILWFFTHTVELVIIVLTCTKASKAANYTAILVHRLLTRDVRAELRNQLKLFSIQLLHRKVCFTAAGFFNLDMTLLQAIIGAATTYLVILIQFHNTYEVPPDFQ